MVSYILAKTRSLPGYMIGTILIFLGILSVLVLVHELGHFVLAKKFGVKVHEFGFGFPPKLWGKKIGETEYTINTMPLGGFVRLKGESTGSSHDTDSFAGQTYGRRTLILLAGILMNFILAWVIFTMLYIFGSTVELNGENLPGAKISSRQVVVAEVLVGSGAERAGIKSNDVLVMINNQDVTASQIVGKITSDSLNKNVVIKVRRNQEFLEFMVVPQIIPGSPGRIGIGVALADTATVKYPWFMAPVKGLETTAAIAFNIVLTLKELLGRLFTAEGSPVGVAGPVGIAMMAKTAAASGWANFLQFVAILSVNLGLINLLPIPALDGGRLAILAISRVRGRSLSGNFERMAHLIGFVLLMILVVYVTYNDIIKLN